MKSEPNPIKRALRRPTPTNAIRAKCAECVGCSSGHMEEGFRQSISECKSMGCPLHSFRPYRVKKGLPVGDQGAGAPDIIRGSGPPKIGKEG